MIFSMLMLFSAFASGSREDWVSVGGEYGHAMENQSVNGVKVNTNLNSVGINFKAMQFNDDKDVGIIADGSFLLPLGGTISLGGASIDYTYQDAETRSHIGMMIGPVFKRSLANGSDFYIGGGPSVQQLGIVGADGSGALSFLFGAGISTGIKVDINERVFWDIGVKSDATFFSLNASSFSSDWYTSSMFNFSVRPHIGIGFKQKVKFEYS